ncbi:hypothetical protein MtrunA17_Chr2g0286361 [Medicago truncatula]|nr:F-box/kelch-repeat protein At3g18720 [Medicago truncatula]RHN72318.1 hypothetical protein MtrunA17_Chr2g0286361 [Medicago truncatula]
MNYEICCSKDGWLLLVGVNKSFQFFFNPFTKEDLPLPFEHKRITNIRCFGMSHSPTSFDCVTVQLDNGSSTITTVAYVHFLSEGVGDRISFKDLTFPHYSTSPAFHNGLFYFLILTGKLAVINPTRGEISWKVLEEPQAPCSSCFNNFLVECDGNLLAVFEISLGKEGVRVFKLDESTMTWMKIESLKNHMLFVGKTSFSAVANIPGLKSDESIKVINAHFTSSCLIIIALNLLSFLTTNNRRLFLFAISCFK